MEAILLWLLVQMITKASEKWKVSQTYLSIWLAILLGAWYYVATTYYSIQWQQIVERVGWVYASSQLFYNLFKKAWLLDGKKE
jgi:hypothetical protein